MACFSFCSIPQQHTCAITQERLRDKQGGADAIFGNLFSTLAIRWRFYIRMIIKSGPMGLSNWLLLSLALFLALIPPALAIRCYQCSSDEDKATDGCGAYEAFDTNKNSPVDCMAEDAVTPGTFCYKSIQQGPRGFIWDGRWRTVIRRCAQISERGISWGCDWGFHENGVYWEECYCAEDGCNGSTGFMDRGSHRNYYLIAITVLIGSTIMTFLQRNKSVI